MGFFSTFLYVYFFYVWTCHQQVSDTVALRLTKPRDHEAHNTWFSLLLPSIYLCRAYTHKHRSLQILTTVANGVLTSNASQSETLLNIDPFFSSGFPTSLLSLPLLNGFFINPLSFFLTCFPSSIPFTLSSILSSFFPAFLRLFILLLFNVFCWF